MKRTLSKKQQRLLDCLEREIERTGTPPSLRQAAQHLGISHAAISQTLKRLEQKGVVKRAGRYSRTIHILNRTGQPAAASRWIEVPIIGRVTAGLPMYAQEEWDGSVVLDAAIYSGQNLFALRIRGDSMKNAGIMDGDLAICEPRQYAQNREIVVALINGEDATVKRFFLHPDHLELRSENPEYPSMHYKFSDVLIQGKVVGIQRGPRAMG